MGFPSNLRRRSSSNSASPSLWTCTLMSSKIGRWHQKLSDRCQTRSSGSSFSLYLSSTTTCKPINTRRGGPQTLPLHPSQAFYAGSRKRTSVSKGRKKGRSPSVGPGPSRHADSFSRLRRLLTQRTRLRTPPLRHCCRHGDSTMLQGVNESGWLWPSASRSIEVPGSLLPAHSQRGA